MSTGLSTSGTPDGAGGGALSPAAFAEAFQAHGRRLWGLAAGILGDPTEAEDVVQEAAVVGLEKLDSFRPGTSFAAWMGQIVRNLALNRSRRRSRRDEVGELDPERVAGPTPAPAPDDPVGPRGELLPDTGSFDDAVQTALRRLAEAPRACLLLRTVLELDYRSIAELLGIPEGTAMSHVHRARALLREALEPRTASEERST